MPLLRRGVGRRNDVAGPPPALTPHVLYAGAFVQQHECPLAVVGFDVQRLPSDRSEHHLVNGEDASVAIVEGVIADSHSVDCKANAFRSGRDAQNLACSRLGQEVSNVLSGGVCE